MLNLIHQKASSLIYPLTENVIIWNLFFSASSYRYDIQDRIFVTKRHASSMTNLKLCNWLNILSAISFPDIRNASKWNVRLCTQIFKYFEGGSRHVTWRNNKNDAFTRKITFQPTYEKSILFFYLFTFLMFVTLLVKSQYCVQILEKRK